MSNAMLQAHIHAVKAGQFIAPTKEAQYGVDFEAGRNAYLVGKRRSWCNSGAMQDGWDDAFEAGRQVNARVMLAAEAM